MSDSQSAESGPAAASTSATPSPLPSDSTSTFGESRLRSEWRDFEDEEIDGISACPMNEDELYVWSGTILGPEESHFEGKLFFLTLAIPHNYPASPPTLTMSTSVSLPGIVMEDGTIEIDILKEENWNSSTHIKDVLLGLRSALRTAV